MSKVAWSVAAFAGLSLIANRGAATILWVGDFETGDLSQWDSTNLITTGDRENLILVNDTVIEGTTAAEITLYPDVIFEPYNQSRVEVKHEGLHTLDGEDSYYAWSFMVPGAPEIRSNIGYWESLVTFRNTMSFWIDVEDNAPVIKFGTGNLGETERWSAPLVLGEWHRIAIHNHWSQDEADGTVSVWYDGELVVDAVTATKYDANELFFQMGLHRSDPADPIQTIYLDAAIEADTLDEILAPLPPLNNGGAGGAAGAGGTAGAASGGAGGMMAGGAGGAAAGMGGVAGMDGSMAGMVGMDVGPIPAGGGGAGGSAGATAQVPVVPSGGQPSTTNTVPTNAETQTSGCNLPTGSAQGTGVSLLALLGALHLLRRRAQK